MPLSNRYLLASTALATLVLVAGASRAQTAPAAPDSSAVTTIGDVVVTAQKRSEKLQKVPISMEVVSGKKLDSFHASDIKSIMNYTPNVFVESTAGDDVIYIRGFGSPPANFSFDQSVSLYVDGIYAGRSRQAQAPFFDLQRVEVLRGPQGALFGKNTPAGAVSVVSANPTASFQGDATASYNFDLKGYDASGFVSGPIAPDLTARLAVKFVDQDGYITNTFNGHHDPEDKQELARLTLRYAPVGKFDYTVKVDYGHRVITGGMNVSSSLTSAQNPQITRYVDSSTPIGQEGTTDRSLMISGTGNWQLGDYTLTSVTGYSYYKSGIVNDFDQSIPGGGTTQNSVYNDFPENFYQVSQEVRLLSPIGRKFEYIIGGYYDNSYYRLIQQVGFNIPAIPFIPFTPYNALEETDFNQRSQTLSAFGQGTYHVFDNLRVVGSLRYTDNEKRADFYGHLVSGFFPLQPLTTAAGKINESNVDPSVTLQYDVAPRVMVYFTWGRGSKSGGFVSNTFGTVDSTFSYRPEKSENFEGGVKSTLFDGKLVLDASIYDTSFTDLQVSVFNPTTTSYLTGNAASASSKGVEWAVAWYPTHNFDVTGSAAYQDVTYDNYPGAACLATQSLAQCNPAAPASITANNIKGAPLPYTSKFSGNIQVHYRLDLPNDLKVDATGVVSGRSKYFDSDNESPTFGTQKGYAKLDLRVQLAPRDERWRLAVVGKNLTNVLTTGSAFDLPVPITANNRAILYLEQTRNVSIEAGVKF